MDLGRGQARARQDRRDAGAVRESRELRVRRLVKNAETGMKKVTYVKWRGEVVQSAKKVAK